MDLRTRWLCQGGGWLAWQAAEGHADRHHTHTYHHHHPPPSHTHTHTVLAVLACPRPPSVPLAQSAVACRPPTLGCVHCLPSEARYAMWMATAKQAWALSASSTPSWVQRTPVSAPGKRRLECTYIAPSLPFHDALASVHCLCRWPASSTGLRYFALHMRRAVPASVHVVMPAPALCQAVVPGPCL